MGMEVSSSRVICYKCGRAFSKHSGYFPASYAVLHKGIGFLPICRECVNTIYNTYLSQCNDARAAVRQVCRKLDVYWNDKIFEEVEKKYSPRPIMLKYLSRLATIQHAGKSYDDTLSEEGVLWDSGDSKSKSIESKPPATINEDEPKKDKTKAATETPQDIIDFWGSGYSDEMYQELEQRRNYYYSKLADVKDIDIGSEILIRQICNLEVNISRDTAAGRSIDKSVNSLNTLLGSLNLKPAQRKNDELDAEISSTPLGVWIYRFENKRPLPEDDSPNKIKKYIFTWMGHLAKMLGLKNAYTKLYEEEVERLRVEKPEYADDDEEDLLIDVYSEEDGDSDG